MKKPGSAVFTAAIVSVVTFAAYLPSLRNSFVEWDDSSYVFDNQYIRAINAAFFKWAFSRFYDGNWHPLTWVSHALDYAVWGLNPLGHHLTSILLHAANTFLVVVLAARLIETAARTSDPTCPPEAPLASGRRGAGFGTGSRLAAATTGLLFGLHPVHVESVAWVAERKDLLCALFFLLSILAYLRYAAGFSHRAQGERHGDGPSPAFARGGGLVRSSRGSLAAALGLFALALLSKPMAVSLPLVLLILDWHPLNRIRSLRSLWSVVPEKIPFFAFSLVSALVTVLAQHRGGAMVMTEVVPLPIRALVAARALVGYLGKIFFPLHLVPYYPYPSDVSLLAPEYLFSLLAAAAVTAAAFVAIRRSKLWLSAWGYYVITLIPVLGIVQVGGQAMADRYTYLPGLGPFLVAGVVVARGWKAVSAAKQSAVTARLYAAAAVCLILSLSYLTFRQTGIWRDTVTLWSYVIEKEPARMPAAYNNRGLALSESGQFDRAIADFNKAIALNPSYYEAYGNRGQVYLSVGQPGKTIEDCDAGIAIRPFHKLYFLRGIAHEEMGRPERALEDYKRAIAVEPSYVEAYARLGVMLGSAGSYEEALGYFDKAVAINQNYALAYADRGYTNALLGRNDRALADYDKAISLDRTYAKVYLNRGNLHLAAGRGGLAGADFRVACDLGDKEGCDKLRAFRP